MPLNIVYHEESYSIGCLCAALRPAIAGRRRSAGALPGKKFTVPVLPDQRPGSY